MTLEVAGQHRGHGELVAAGETQRRLLLRRRLEPVVELLADPRRQLVDQ